MDRVQTSLWSRMRFTIELLKPAGCLRLFVLHHSLVLSKAVASFAPSNPKSICDHHSPIVLPF